MGTIGMAEVLVEGKRVHYILEGDGPPVVLVHGNGGSLRRWRLCVPLLGEHFQVVALDLPGFGDSDLLGSYPTWEDYLRFLTAFLDTLGLPRASFIGHGVGGLLILDLALREPARVDRLVVVGSMGIRKGTAWINRLLTVPWFARVAFRVALSRKALLRRFSYLSYLCYQPRSIPLSLLREMRDDYRRSRAFHRMFRIVNRGLIDELGEVKAQTLVVWGKEDRALPVTNALEFHRRIHRSRMVLLERCGHLPMIERPATFCHAVTSFLRELRTT